MSPHTNRGVGPVLQRGVGSLLHRGANPHTNREVGTVLQRGVDPLLHRGVGPLLHKGVGPLLHGLSTSTIGCGDESRLGRGGGDDQICQVLGEDLSVDTAVSTTLWS
jgi:hypothetical protein